MDVRHVRRSSTAATPSLVELRHHLIHVAFNNQIHSGEKRIDGRPVTKHIGRTVGRSMILPAGTALWGWAVGDVDFLKLEIHPDTLAAARDETGHEPGGLRPRLQIDDPVLWHLACALRADMARGQPGGQLFRDGVERLVATHLTSVHFGSGRPSAAARGALSVSQFRKVREFLEANLHRDLRLAEIAGVVGLSTFHFARAFKAAAGTSPYRFLLEQRLTSARRLLEATDLAVGEIGRLTGFLSLTGFSAAFRQRWGVPPSQYRRAVRA